MPTPLPLLSAFYFGSVDHYRLMAPHARVMVDIGEHHVRQSYRTRTRILGPNGPQDLSVQVVHGHGEKVPIRDVRLSLAETWPQQHLHAIRSAYGKSPWFLHYVDDMEAVLLADHQRLVDLDLATMRLGLKWLGLRTELVVSEEYIEAGGGDTPVLTKEQDDQPSSLMDLRGAFHPKRPVPAAIPATPPYPQVFADRHGFVPRLSIIDLVMNTGPRAASLLVS